MIAAIACFDVEFRSGSIRTSPGSALNVPPSYVKRIGHWPFAIDVAIRIQPRRDQQRAAIDRPHARLAEESLAVGSSALRCRILDRRTTPLPPAAIRCGS